MRNSDALPFVLLAAGSAVVEAIQDGMKSRGFAELRPAHGFTFVRIAEGDCTVADVAEILSVSKQAASQTVKELIAGGFVRSSRHPADGRAVLLELTERGRTATAAATESAAELVAGWTEVLGQARVNDLTQDLASVVGGVRIRPVW